MNNLNSVAWKFLGVILLLSIVSFVPLLVFSPESIVGKAYVSVSSDAAVIYSCPDGYAALSIKCANRDCGNERMGMRCVQVDSKLLGQKEFSASKSRNCPANGVVTGFNCGDSCSGEKMRIICSQTNAKLEDSLWWSNFGAEEKCPDGYLMAGYQCSNDCSQRRMRVACRKVICDNDGKCDDLEDTGSCIDCAPDEEEISAVQRNEECPGEVRICPNWNIVRKNPLNRCEFDRCS